MRPKPIHATADDTEINVNDETEVQRWCDELGVSEQQLRNAVQNAGNKLSDVEKELANSTTEDSDVTPAEDIPTWEQGGGTDTSARSGMADE
jgi:hypothetical protein